MENIQISKRDILENFDDRSYSRGFTYYQQKKVIDYSMQDDDLYTVSVSAKVQGAKKYRQYIELSIDEDGLLIESDCSCPVGYNCKHAVAVLFQIMANGMSPKHKDESAVWLKKFLDLQKKKETAVLTKQEHFLIFRLFESPYNDLEFYKAKILKNGSLSKGSKISKENLMYYAQYDWKYDFVTEEDKKLITYLKNTSSTHYSNHFQGEYGTLVLKKLCESQHCYFRKNDSPLKFDKRIKSLTFEWQEKAGESRLVSNLKASEFLIKTTIPLLCIDSDANILYEVETSFSVEELICLFEAPKFSAKSVENVTKSILQAVPELDFPIPKTFQMETLVTDVKSALYLYSTNTSAKQMPVMELHFFYDDFEVNSFPQNTYEIFFLEEKRIKVLRDGIKEQESREVIESLGFVFDKSLNAYVALPEAGRQEEIEKWRNFIENRLPELRDRGWQIEIDERFNFNFEYVEQVLVENSSNSQTNPWFELSFSVDIGGRNVSLLPIVASLLQEFDSVDELPAKLNLEMEEGYFLHIDAAEIKPILTTIFELYDKKEGDVLVIKPYDAHLIAFDSQNTVVWKGMKELKALSLKLKNFKGIEAVSPAASLQATLREYQQFGLDWLYFLYSFNFAGILADDMGLGKTVQTLAFLQLLKEKGKMQGPTLIVMPTSLIGNWKNEIRKFTPDLSYLELYGIDRAEKFKDIASHDIVLTTYALAQRDKEKYDKENFFYIILDEAQKIKNPKTKLAVAIKGFKGQHRLALTGTPIENHLGELWSIFDFLMPGFLDSLSAFKSFYQNPIESDKDISRKEWLNKKVSPFILRRTKDEVVKELPAKTEIVKKAVFGKKQAALYENIRITMEKKVRETIQGKGLSRSHITILDALLKLRQVCCHPTLLKLEQAKKVSESSKLEMFLELVDELHTEGRKVLVFSQFTSMLSILEEEIKKRKISYSKLTGATRKREEVIDRFTSGEADIFLISLKAGGVGLNLVEADTVIHYDPWWNPAVENQATDRAYRIGQDKPVFVYKLIVENSIEEQILKLQEKKKSLQNSIYSKEGENEEKFSGEDLVALLKM